MSAVALANPGQPPISQKQPARVRVSPRLAEAIRLIETGEVTTIKAAAERVKMNYTHLSEALRKPNVQVFIAQRRAANIQLGALRASNRFPALVDAESEHVAAKVSERLLEQSGDLKTASSGQVSVNVGVSVGYVIDLTPQQPGARTIEHEARSDAE